MKKKIKRICDVLRAFGVTGLRLYVFGFWVGFAFFFGIKFAVSVLTVIASLY